MKMAELAAMHFANRFIEAFKNGHALRRDTRQHHAAVTILTASRDKSPLLKAVEQAGNVGIASDHQRGDLAAEKSVGGAAQDAQNIVLSQGEIFGFEDLRRAPGEQVGGTKKVDKQGFFGAGNGTVSERLAHSVSTVIVVTTIVNKRGD
jgi:hypothetical protein